MATITLVARHKNNHCRLDPVCISCNARVLSNPANIRAGSPALTDRFLDSRSSSSQLPRVSSKSRPVLDRYGGVTKG
jgi:hypothetical protein